VIKVKARKVKAINLRKGHPYESKDVFPVGPQILDRVQFRRIGREKLQPQASSLLLHKVPHGAAAMARQTIPDDQQFAGNVAQQMREKLEDLRAANGSGKQPEVEVPPGHARDRRQHLPVEVIRSDGATLVIQNRTALEALAI
jgi:hypothetical protein